MDALQNAVAMLVKLTSLAACLTCHREKINPLRCATAGLVSQASSDGAHLPTAAAFDIFSLAGSC